MSWSLPLAAGLLILATAAGLSMWLTHLVIGYTRRRAILDHPTERSSHSEPTPRGGGLAIVATVLLAIAGLAPLGLIPVDLALGLGGGGALVAWVGWQDDRHEVAAGLRALVQCVAAIWAVIWIGGLPQLTLGGSPIPLGPAGTVLAVLGIVWSVNLFNFMDGIDGIAGVEAVTVGVTGAILLCLGGAGGPALLSALIAAATLGFLRWNWMPARIFLGDVGSNFLGFAFAVLAIWSDNAGRVPAVWWGLAALVFILDATITLVRRAARREPIFQAHRTHAYQRLTQAGLSHADVSRAVLGLNVLLSGLSVAGFYWWHQAAIPLLAGVILCLSAYLAAERRRPM